MTVEINEKCLNCPKLSLPQQAIAKGEELIRFSNAVHVDAEEMAHHASWSDQLEYMDEDGSLIPWGQAMGYYDLAESRFSESRDIEAGGRALIFLGETAITECQTDCSGPRQFQVEDQAHFFCNGNKSSESLRALRVDYGEGGLELSDTQPGRTLDAVVTTLKGVVETRNIDKA